LLKHLTEDTDLQAVVLALPLPPFCHQYGHAQRRLAAKYRVVPVLQRVVLSVLAEDGATLDSIHLLQCGHQKMADAVWQIIRSGFDSRTD